MRAWRRRCWSNQAPEATAGARRRGTLPPMLRLPSFPLGALSLAAACVALAYATPAPAPATLAAPAAAKSTTRGCLPTGNGYLRARIRGALDLDIDWHNAEIECEGGLRPDGSGLRVS